MLRWESGGIFYFVIQIFFCSFFLFILFTYDIIFIIYLMLLYCLFLFISIYFCLFPWFPFIFQINGKSIISFALAITITKEQEPPLSPLVHPPAQTMPSRTWWSSVRWCTSTDCRREGVCRSGCGTRASSQRHSRLGTRRHCSGTRTWGARLHNRSIWTLQGRSLMACSSTSVITNRCAMCSRRSRGHTPASAIAKRWTWLPVRCFGWSAQKTKRIGFSNTSWKEAPVITTARCAALTQTWGFSRRWQKSTSQTLWYEFLRAFDL